MRDRARLLALRPLLPAPRVGASGGPRRAVSGRKAHVERASRLGHTVGKTRSGEAYSGLHASSLKRPYRCAHIVPAVERTHSGSATV